MRRLGFGEGFIAGLAIVLAQALVGAGAGCWAGDRIERKMFDVVKRQSEKRTRIDTKAMMLPMEKQESGRRGD